MKPENKYVIRAVRLLRLYGWFEWLTEIPFLLLFINMFIITRMLTGSQVADETTRLAVLSSVYALFVLALAFLLVVMLNSRMKLYIFTSYAAAKAGQEKESIWKILSFRIINMVIYLGIMALTIAISLTAFILPVSMTGYPGKANWSQWLLSICIGMFFGGFSIILLTLVHELFNYHEYLKTIRANT